MLLNNAITFQKALALVAAATTEPEAAAAEAAVRRMLVNFKIDPTRIPDTSLYNHMRFDDNVLLKKLREEWRAEHPKPPKTPKQRQQPSEPTEDSTPFPIPFSIRGYRRTAHRNRKKQQRPPRPDAEKAAEMIRGWIYQEPAITLPQLTEQLRQQQELLQHMPSDDTIRRIRQRTQTVLLELNEMGYLTEPLASRLRDGG